MRIAILGPVHPYRGGIAHSNTLLCENLSKKHTILPLSFSMLYPKMFFPGKSQKEESGRRVRIRPKEIINSLNPLSWLRVFLEVKRFKPRLVILQWWTLFLFPFSLFTLAMIRMFTKSKICIVTANVLQHERSFVDIPLTKLVFSLSHYFICLTEGDKAKLLRFMPDARAEVLIEPTFENVFDLEKKDFEKKRLEIGARERTILFFGIVREYKGLRYLLMALPQVLKKIDLDLVIAGEFWSDKKEYLDLIKELDIGDHVKIDDRYIPDDEVGLYFGLCDAVIMPYTSGSQSGIIQLAFGADTPVICSDTESIADLVKDGKNGFVVTPMNPSALAEAIIRFYQEDRKKAFSQYIREDKKKYRWGPDKEKILFHGLTRKVS